MFQPGVIQPQLGVAQAPVSSVRIPLINEPDAAPKSSRRVLISAAIVAIAIVVTCIGAFVIVPSLHESKLGMGIKASYPSLNSFLTTPASSSAVSTSDSYVYMGSYALGNGPSWSSNPVVYSCVEACAAVYGGVSTQYQCSTLSSSINRLAYVDGWGSSSYCSNPTSDTYKVGTTYNCGSVGCSYSAYVSDHCPTMVNYCYRSGSVVSSSPTVKPTIAPTLAVVPTVAPTSQPTSGSFTIVGSYKLGDGPTWSSNPVVYSCVEACAAVYGGVSTQYQCSTLSSSINRLAYVDGWGSSTYCSNPTSDTYKVGTTYNCGSVGCSYSAYVNDHCTSATNYCYRSGSVVSSSPTVKPTIAPTFAVVPTIAPTVKSTSTPTSSQGYVYVGTYAVNSGPSWTTNPPTYSCVEACAIVFGGQSSQYQCSTLTSTINRMAYLDGYASRTYCSASNPAPDTYKLGSTYNCGTAGCSYSAYVTDGCSLSNYCYRIGSVVTTAPTVKPTIAPSTFRPTAKPTSAPTSQSYVLVGSYAINSGPVWTTNPPTYSCIEACALVYGGESSQYQCSTVSSLINRLAYLDGWGSSTYCSYSSNPAADNYKLGSTYNCGTPGCSYSAYVSDHCSLTNYCFRFGSVQSVVPTVKPTAKPSLTPTTVPTTAVVVPTIKPTSFPTSSNSSFGYIGSYKLSSGPSWSTNPPTYSCVEACAAVFGGQSSQYQCSTVLSSINRLAYLDGYASSTHCTSPMSDTYKLGTNYNCGTAGCSYSAYVGDNCLSTTNNCFRAGYASPTSSPTLVVPTVAPTIKASLQPTYSDSSFVYVGNYMIGNGPAWSSNPPVYSCIEACAVVYGGQSSQYQCSTVSSSINRLAYVDGWGSSLYCSSPTSDTFKVGTTYNCGTTGCSYSAFVTDHCSTATNYCFRAGAVSSSTSSLASVVSFSKTVNQVTSSSGQSDSEAVSK